MVLRSTSSHVLDTVMPSVLVSDPASPARCHIPMLKITHPCLSRRNWVPLEAVPVKCRILPKKKTLYLHVLLQRNKFAVRVGMSLTSQYQVTSLHIVRAPYFVTNLADFGRAPGARTICEAVIVPAGPTLASNSCTIRISVEYSRFLE